LYKNAPFFSFIIWTAYYTLSDQKSEIIIIINFANSRYTTLQMKLERKESKNKEGCPKYLQNIRGRWWLQNMYKTWIFCFIIFITD
jgi:hypothetical protein